MRFVIYLHRQCNVKRKANRIIFNEQLPQNQENGSRECILVKFACQIQ